LKLLECDARSGVGDVVEQVGEGLVRKKGLNATNEAVVERFFWS
jgi:pantoate kinase